MLNKTIARDKNVTYSIGCDSLQADEVVPTIFTGATNCTKDFMAVSGAVGQSLGKGTALSCRAESDTSMASQSNLEDVSVDSLWVVGVRK